MAMAMSFLCRVLKRVYIEYRMIRFIIEGKQSWIFDHRSEYNDLFGLCGFGLDAKYVHVSDNIGQEVQGYSE